MSGVGLKYSSWNAKVIQPKWALPSSINLYPPNTSVDYSSPTYSQSPPQEILIRIPPFLLLIIITYKTSQKNRITFVHDRSKICIHSNMSRNLSIPFLTRRRRGRKEGDAWRLRIETNLFVERSSRYHELVTKGPNFSISIRIFESPLGIRRSWIQAFRSRVERSRKRANRGWKGRWTNSMAEFHFHPLAHERPYNGIIKWPVWSIADSIRGKGDVVQIVKRLWDSLTHWFRYWNCYWFRIDRNALMIIIMITNSGEGRERKIELEFHL